MSELKAENNKYKNRLKKKRVFQLSSQMAALWLQSVSLLVLMLVSWSGSQALVPPQHLCGAHLVDALYLVCGERGFFYTPKRDVDPLLGENTTAVNTEPWVRSRDVKGTRVSQVSFLPSRAEPRWAATTRWPSSPSRTRWR